MDKKKELEELMLGLGYVAGEVTEATSDGIGLEDLKSIKDMVNNKDLILKMKVEGDLKELIKDLSMEDLVAAFMKLAEGYKLGKK